eukprot:XP_011616442.1 PREDICTED: LOW QUALITY PROTEIN: zinc finger protein 36, C3H1 type-like 1 [Takifugu rubripes]
MIRQKMDSVPPASGGCSQKALKPPSFPTATYGESLASLRSVPSAWWRPAAPPQRAWGGTGATLNPTTETSVPPHCTPAPPPPPLQFLPSSRYKTELCRSFTESGFCKYGGKCQFAHGAEELRDLNRHPKYKTEPCRTFHTIGFCPYGVRCHFVHNGDEEKPFSRSSSFSSSFSSSSSAMQQPPSSSRMHRPPLIRQSFSFPGFPLAPQQLLKSSLTTHPPPTSFTLTPSASPPSCADITDLLSQALLDMDSAFEASPAPQYQASAAGPQSPFLPSPDSGCSPCGPSPNTSPSLRHSSSAARVFSGSLGVRSLSYTSLSDQDQDGSSSASSLSGSETCGGTSESGGRRLAVFSQLSVPEDPVSFCL